jgi:hypothetical protein
VTPHLIHVGYPKTASNFLRTWFEEHEEIGFAHGKVAGFGNVQEIARAGEGRGPLLRVTSSENFIAPGGGGDFAEDQVRICGRLSALFSGAHVLIVTRGFRSMILSSYSQHVRCGGTIEIAEMAAQGLAAGAWDYDRAVALYAGAFGADKVMVLPWELLRDDPGAFTAAIEGRFGLVRGPLPEQRINAALSGAELRWYPAIGQRIAALPVGRRVRARLSAAFAKAAFGNRLKRPIALLQRLRPKAAVGAEAIPEALLERFRGHASSLAALPAYAPYGNDYLF